jgi:dolichol-phosphate mannosyltransferase
MSGDGAAATAADDLAAGAGVLVCIPTYDERDNLPSTLARLRSAVPHAMVLVIDDSSPDGTGDVADSLAAADDHVHVLHRPGKAGLGAAYVAGFSWGLERGADVLVEMDADGSHAPEELPRLLRAVAGGADLAIGSRYVPGGEVRDWPTSRLLLSRGGNAYTRLVLGVPVRDATAGYRAYRSAILKELDLAGISSQGYCFQVDLLWRAVLHGARVVEVPITFTERQLGASKMSSAIVTEALWRVTVWGIGSRLRGLGGRDGLGWRDRGNPGTTPARPLLATARLPRDRRTPDL